MGKSKRAWRARTGFQPHGFSTAEPGKLWSAARPAAEAALLAAVALGCAQLGMNALSAPSAHSSSPDGRTDTDAAAHAVATAAPVRSPFSPSANLAEPSGSSLLATLRVSGVRMSDESGRSGAIFVVDGQNQRAFSIGQEVVQGVRLASVENDHVTLAYDGGERQVAVEQAPQRFSFAAALMGEEQNAPPPPEVRFISDTPPAVVVAAAPQPATPFTANQNAASEPASTRAQPSVETWLVSTLSRVETTGQAPGWRVAAPLPPMAQTAGLQEGDLVVAVNGLGPERSAEAAGAAAAGAVRLDVLRGDTPISVTLGADLGDGSGDGRRT